MGLHRYINREVYMAISIGDNLNIRMRKQNVERDSFVTLQDMREYGEESLPNIFIATCEETGKIYLYQRNNEYNELTGKWREYKTDSSEPDNVLDSWVIV